MARERARVERWDDGAELREQALRWRGGTLVRFDRRMHGLPVHGGDVVVAVGARGGVRRVRGRPVDRVGRPPQPRVDGQEAVARARELGRRLGQGELWSPRPELAWWVGEGGRPVLTWAVDLSTEAPVATWRTWIDATTGEIRHTEPTSRSSRAWVYPANPVTSSLQEVPLLGLDEDAAVLSGEHTWVQSCEQATVSGGLIGPVACDGLVHQATADEAGDFLFEPAPEELDDPGAEVQVYYHVDRVAAFLDQRYGFRLPRPIRGVVNFEMTNAFYGDFDGDGHPDVCFGQDEETGVDFAYDGDVVYHEFGHAVVDRVANLGWVQADEWGMDWVPGSINEGYADVLAIVLTGDPLLAEYAGSAVGRQAIRDLTSPRRCPDDMPGEVHADGEVLGHLAWSLMGDLGPELTHDLFFGALAFWGRDVTWPRVGQTLLDSASDLRDAAAMDEGAHARVVEALEQANLLDCPRYRLLQPGESTYLYAVNLGLPGEWARIPMGVQLALDVPEDADTVRLEIRELVGAVGAGWSVFTRAGEHVGHEVNSLPGVGMAVARPDVYDGVWDGEGDGVIELSLDDEVPFVPGERLYIALSSRNLGDMTPFDIQYGVLEVQVGVARLAVDDHPLVRGGGGCATAAGSVGAWPLLALLGLSRRRRRR